jgi:serine/threonine protein kinase
LETAEQTYKIADFGLMVHHSKGLDSVYGEEGFVAPELKFQEILGFGNDIYSLGVTLYWLATRNEVGLRISEGHLAENNFSLEGTGRSKELHSIIQEMTQKDPKQRISLNQIIESYPNLKNIMEIRARLTSKIPLIIHDPMDIEENSQQNVRAQKQRSLSVHSEHKKQKGLKSRANLLEV